MISSALLLAEMDDLTVTLFEEAHEMVRVEKEARHKDHVLLKETQDQTTVLMARPSHIVYQNGATSGFEMYFWLFLSDPSTLGAGAKTRLESRRKMFTPLHCICSPLVLPLIHI